MLFNFRKSADEPSVFIIAVFVMLMDNIIGIAADKVTVFIIAVFGVSVGFEIAVKFSGDENRLIAGVVMNMFFKAANRLFCHC